MRLTIDTEKHTYEQALVGTGRVRQAPRRSCRLARGAGGEPASARVTSATPTSERLERAVLSDVISALMSGARQMIRPIVDVGGMVTHDSVQQYFVGCIPRSAIGGTLVSV
ncbi:hypothetical protein [Streptomyces huasconensis]|uniref:hypothetical protein n=1 Tax=Streptomyces huasconensis TaxID=1854574 RepID=UPI0033F5C58B